MSEPLDHTELSTALIAGLAVQANSLADAARDLRASFQLSRQLRFIIAAFVILITGLLIIALINLSTGRAIRSCTTPKGTCYQRSQEATAKAVTDIVTAINAHTDQLVIATLQCSRRPLSDVQFAVCLRSKGIR